MNANIDEHRVYLYKLDIDENGSLIAIDDNTLDSYLLSYAMVFDRVILQSSAFFKRMDLYYLLLYYPTLFLEKYNGKPIVSPYRGIHEESSIQYLEGRLIALSKGSKSNSEYLSYEKNDAKNIAIDLDEKLPSDGMPKALKITDKVFRQLVVSEAQKENQIFSLFKEGKRALDILEKSAKGDDTFQTFLVKEKIRRKTALRYSEMNQVGNMLRRCYYEANAEATGCYSIGDYHVSYANVKKFLVTTDLAAAVETFVRSIRCHQMVQIKDSDGYKKLQSLYFNLSNEGINEMYTICTRSGFGKKFYNGNEFRRFCHRQGIDYKEYRIAFDQLYTICEQLKRSRIVR